jgi:DNA helicase II / ATP-dependent DNA helicase PcrA
MDIFRGNIRSFFGMSPDAVRNWLQTNAEALSAVLTVSSLDESLSGIPPDCAVIQDLPSPELDRILPILVKRIVYPLWLRGASVFFLSYMKYTDYLPAGISSSSIHSDRETLERFLLRSQLYALLSEPGPVSVTDAGVSTDGLDEQQRRAAAHLHGPMCVLAPAGSGKTKTLVSRIAYMTTAGIPQDSILALAYNTKAAAEMKGRLQSNGIADVTVRTFHSLGFEICRTAGWRFDPEETDAGQIVAETLGNAFGTPALLQEFLPVIMQAVARTKSELSFPSIHLPCNGIRIPFSEFFSDYYTLLSRHRRLAFDDMVYVALRILIDDSTLRAAYQRRFRYILVDEFQDLNAAQMLMLQILALPRNHLFAVGDDDQMIYGWRGADVRHLISFSETYPSAQQIVLQTNYRSSTDVVKHSRRLIEHNLNRIAKDIRPRPAAPEGSFTIERALTLRAQAEIAVAWILRTQSARGCAWNDFAFLYRTNIMQIPIALVLDDAGIPHSPLRFDLFLDTHVVRLLLRILRVLSLAHGSESPVFRLLLRELGVSRKLSEQIYRWQDLEDTASWSGISPVEGRTLLRARTGLLHLRSVASMPGAETRNVLQTVDDVFGLRSEHRVRRHREPDEPGDADVYTVLYSLAGRYPVFSDFCTAIDRWERSAQDDEHLSSKHPERDEVVLSTIHRTKGNEFRFVVFFNMNNSGKIDAREMEEERRVAYVGLTRARDALLITAPAHKYIPFLAEAALDPEYAGTSSPVLHVKKLAAGILERTGLPLRPGMAPSAVLARELIFRRKVR